MTDQVAAAAANELAQLQSQYSAAVADAKKLSAEWAGKTDVPPEINTQIEAKLGAADTYKARIQMLKRLQSHEDFRDEPATEPLAWRNSAPNEGNVPVDPKSWRSIKCKTFFGFEREIRYFVPLFLNEEKKSRDYADAFEAHLRKRGGFSAIGYKDQKTLSEGVDAVGGFTVPPDFQAEIIKKTMTLTQMRANARLSTTSRDVQVWPKITYTTDDNYTSAVRLTWSGEAPASSLTIRASDPGFGLYSIPVHTAMASVPLTNDLLEDSAVDVNGIVTDLFAEAFALGEEQAFVSGTGIGQPMGIFSEIGTNGPSSITTINVGAIAGDDLIKVYYALPVQYRQNAKWMLSSPSMQAVELLKDSQNRYLISSLINASLAMPQFDSIKGKEILIDEFTPTIASNNYPILFGDFQGYLIVDRVGLTVQKLQELYAELNLTLLLGRKRVGGYCIQPWRLRGLKIQ